MPQSYCTRYGIELARLTVYKAANLASAASEQQGVVDRWKKRCQYKLEELAVCNSFRVLNAAGGPTATAQCPFTLSVVASLAGSYSVTPGCLLVVWDTQGQDGIYDPCICVSCVNTPNIDVPAQLTSLCKLESFQTLVAKDAIPSESTTGVPLGSGSFRTLMDKAGFLQINTPNITHWAIHTAIRDADLVLDWWPDEWKHPVGYHVTPGCSRPRDAHWRTFDASWRWDSQAEEMHLARDESSDPMLSRNAFGAAGVCRTNNYGMPITSLNTMAVCTKENANAKSDPMVPPPSPQTLAGKKEEDWIDGKENCATEHTSTPWAVDTTVNPPRQWSVGTLHKPSDNNRLKPLLVSEWGTGCGPYPLRTCRTSDDCASGLTCLRSSTGTTGVCGVTKDKSFECTAHVQCPEDRMCAGDGVCVDGVWQVRNNMPEAIAFRTFSEECTTGVPLDTWGTSVAESVPDILNASGLCSYRSWFENRRMSQRNSCTQTDTCAEFSGLQPWNFTSPKRRQSAGSSAFESQVLRVKAHVCDRDYHYMEGFVSCTPSANFARMYLHDKDILLPLGTPFITDNRTRTYRTGEDKILPLMHHMENAVGPTYGFTGIPATYTQLRLGGNNPSIIPCSSLRICSFQPSFRVNGVQIGQRLVIDSGSTRGYRMQDLLQCGVFGYQTEDLMCRIDYAVAPLAGMLLLQLSDLLQDSEYSSVAGLTESYPPDDASEVLRMLTAIPDLIIAKFIGGKPTSLQDYVAKSAIFEEIYDRINRIDKPAYDNNAGKPRQIYKLLRYGAFEVPFMWWYKCSWIGGFPLTTDTPISNAQCSWREQGTASAPTAFGAYDSKVAKLFQIPIPTIVPSKNVSLATLLTKLPGVVTKQILEAAKEAFTTERNEWTSRIAQLLQDAKRFCYYRKDFVPEFNTASERYQLQRLLQVYDDVMFDLTNPYLGRDNKTEVCKGEQCLKSAGRSIPTGSNSDLPKQLADATKATPIETITVPFNSRVTDGDGVTL